MSEYDISTFKSIPWVADLLRDESFITVEPWLQAKMVEDKLFQSTLNSPSKLKAFLPQYRKTRKSEKSSSEMSDEVEELRLFWLLGSDLDGNPGMLHGGIIMTLLDEAMGLVLVLDGYYAGSPKRESSQPAVTAYLNTKFRRPISTPAAIMVHVQLIEKVEDRKWKVQATVYDSGNQALASGEGLFVKLRAKI